MAKKKKAKKKKAKKIYGWNTNPSTSYVASEGCQQEIYLSRDKKFVWDGEPDRDEPIASMEVSISINGKTLIIEGNPDLVKRACDDFFNNALD